MSGLQIEGSKKAFMRRLKYWIILTFLCPLLVWIIKGYRFLIRFRCQDVAKGLDQRKRVAGIYVVFHSKLLYAAWMLMVAKRYRAPATIELSPSRDGEIAARILTGLGFRVVRGSGKRKHFSAAKNVMNELESGHWVGVALDGPRGPRGKISSAVLHYAQKTGCPLVPIDGRARSEWRLPTWDRFRIPKPFSRAEGIVHDAIFIPSDADEAAIESVKTRLRELMEEPMDEL